MPAHHDDQRPDSSSATISSSPRRPPFPDERARDLRHWAIAEAGGEKYLAAIAVLERLPRAVRPHSRIACHLNAEVRTAEAHVLREFAVASGLLLDGLLFERTWRAQGEMGGAENDLWYDERTGLVWKRNRIDVMHVSWRQFFDRMLLHNAFFPEAPVHLEGFVDSDAGLCPVFTQPDVHATRGAQRAEVEPWMLLRGYRRTSGENYQNRHRLVEDLHDGNVLVDPEGEIQVIDPVLFVADSV